MSNDILDFHGLPKSRDTVLSYCSQARKVKTHGYTGDLPFGAGMHEHFTWWRCPDTDCVMVECNYCDHWSTCYDQTFCELHLLGGDNDIPECEHVSSPFFPNNYYLLLLIHMLQIL
jgi:hypothetical protein